MKMISFMNQIVLQNMDYHSTPVDFDEKCATIFVDRLTNLTITFLSPRCDKRAMHSSIIFPKLEGSILELLNACTTIRQYVSTVTSRAHVSKVFVS